MSLARIQKVQIYVDSSKVFSRQFSFTINIVQFEIQKLYNEVRVERVKLNRKVKNGAIFHEVQ